jgi:hypothetical protein
MVCGMFKLTRLLQRLSAVGRQAEIWSSLRPVSLYYTKIDRIPLKPEEREEKVEEEGGSKRHYI